uniref:Uncharacterized protein TCIL3000_10_170 n=1 Tax=Trypanosoma congolense (strain IL3000) TaxID=1068625 RepID=G0UV44_TRYCI|nr:unnamed protein product [Trypanosoma congolense IL3000]
MWTVHEDECAKGELDHLDMEQNQSSPVNDLAPKSIGTYTKSSQVFANSCATPVDGSSPSGRGATTLRLAVQEAPGSPAATDHPFFRHQAATNSIMRADAPPFEPSSSSIAAAISFVETPAGCKRGVPPPIMSPSNHCNPLFMFPVEDLHVREKDRGAPHYMEWGNHSHNSYHPLSVMRFFNAGGSGGLTAESLRGKVYEAAKDQHGCRYLQRLLCDSDPDKDIPRTIMSEIVPHVDELMTDQYANFLVQKLFDIMPADVRLKVATVAAPKIAAIALKPHGTFSVQKMIETISSQEELVIIREALSKDVVRLVKDANGNHAIQKVLQRFGHADKEFIYAAVAADCVTIAKNKQGCCVLQRCLEHASPSQRSTLVRHILGCCLEIAEDPYGNYVLQYVISTGDNNTIDTIAIAFLPHLVQLCINKFSSNVMEKVLGRVSLPVQEMYVNKMCSPEVAARLIQDDFGNYVLQTALTICSPAQAEHLVSILRPLVPSIKNTPYAKKLEGKIESVLQKIANDRVLINNCDITSHRDRHEPRCNFTPHRQERYHGVEVRAPRH